MSSGGSSRIVVATARLWLLATTTLLGLATLAAGQPVANPRIVEFAPSADHVKTLADGTAAVTRYDFEIYVAGAAAPFHTISLGKPAPQGDGLIRFDFSATIAAWPLPGGTYESRVAAVGPSGTGRSAASNPFTITATCSYTVSPIAVSAGYGAGTTAIAVSAGAGCAWSASSGASWIAIAPAGGSGNGSVTLTTSANTATAPRTGTVTIAGKTVTVTQAAAPAPCSYTVTPLALSVTSAAGTTSVSVTTTAGCGWTASSDASWLTVSPASASGNGSVTLTYTANTGTTERTRTLTVAGTTVTVTQAAAPAPCSFTVTPLALSVTSAAATTSVSVTTTAGCGWTASSSASWLTVSPASASGNGSVTLTYTANTGTTERTGTLTVAGTTVTVTQAAAPAPCSFTVAPVSLSVGSAAGLRIVGLATGPGCSWTASSQVSWIAPLRSSGSGGAWVAMWYAANPETTARTGTVTVAGQTVAVTQAATAAAAQLDAPLGRDMVIAVATEPELQAAVLSATRDTTIAIAPGTYRLTQPLRVRGADGVTLRGSTGRRDDVVLAGSGLAGDAGGATDGVWTDTSGFTLADLTVGDFPGSGVVFAVGAQAPRLENVRVADAGTFLRTESDGSAAGVNDGAIEGSMFEYTGIGRDASAGGLDLRGANGWTVRDSVFRNIRAPLGSRVRPAVLAWDGSANTTIERNWFIDCQVAIALGAPEGTVGDHADGVVRDNVILGGADDASGAVGIAVTQSPGTHVLHNLVVLSGPRDVPIASRPAGATGADDVIRDNLVGAPAGLLDGAIGTLLANPTFAPGSGTPAPGPEPRDRR